MDRITLQTSDGVTIVADFTPAGEAKLPAPAAHGSLASSRTVHVVALLLHMMPADRTSWKPLSEKLAQSGIASLAIDLRGHGESTHWEAKLPASAADGSLASVGSAEIFFDQGPSNGPRGEATLNYKTFTDEQHQASRLDVDKALEWFQGTRDFTPLPPPYLKGDKRGLPVVVIGASIGANLAIDAAARYPEITKVVMLSGGLDFRGLLTEPAAKLLAASSDRSVGVTSQMFLVASADDDYSLQSHRTLAKILGYRATLKEFQNAGHGTTMFANEPKIIDEIIAWLVE